MEIVICTDDKINAGVDYQDDKGDMLSIGTIMRNLGSRFKEGVDPNQLLNFAEAISGEKIHADIRRKLDSFIEQTQKNGGKMSGADMLKMSSMLAGTEHMGKLLAVMLGDWDAMAEKMDNVHGTAKDMANIQLDNLAGDITILGSAWDAFQQDLVEGSAAEGLRSFVQTLTEMISNAQNLFKDGIQIGDFGKIIFDVVDRLRSKFMELDGIGSILAGGVLMGALTKIGSKIRSLVTGFRELRMGSFGTSAGTSSTQGKPSKEKTGAPPTTQGKPPTPGVPPTPGAPPTTGSRFAGAKSAGVLGAGMSAAFGVMDVMGVKEHSAQRLAEAKDTVTYHENQLRSLQQAGATQEQINAQIREVNDAKAFVARTEKLNHAEELRAGAGATGMVAGTAIGTALGTALGPVGMMLGGMIGGMIGDALGQKVADWKIERDKDKPQTQPKSFFDVPRPSETVQETSPEIARRKRQMGGETRQEEATRKQNEFFNAVDSKLGVSSPFANSATLNATQDFYKQQQQFMKPNQNAKQYEFKNPFADFEFKNPFADFEFKNPFADFEFKNPFADFEFENPFEGFEFENPFANLFEGFELPEFDFTFLDDITTRISEFASTLPETLSGAFDGVGELISSIGSQVSEGFSSAFEGAGEVFSGLGEMISSGLEGAAATAEGALSTISTTFDSAREGIMSAWSELPSFFGGIFDGLGGVASSAGSAILSGLTSVCGAVISAWESVASTVSSIISTISAAASSVASMIPSIGGGGGGVGKAEGGFVSAETHFYAGEHGAEVVIPLSSSHRNRALDLYKKTGAILGGEPMNFGSDEIKPEPERDALGNLMGVDIPEYNRINGDETISVQRDKRAAQEALLNDNPVVQEPPADSPKEISMGGVNISFNVTGENPQEIMEAIREHLAEVTDSIAGKLSEQIAGVHANQPLEG